MAGPSGTREGASRPRARGGQLRRSRPSTLVFEPVGRPGKIVLVPAGLLVAALALELLSLAHTLAALIVLGATWVLTTYLRRMASDLPQYEAAYARSIEVGATIAGVDWGDRLRPARPMLRFRTLEGYDMTAIAQVRYTLGGAHWVLLGAGRRVRVRYDPTDPRWVVPAGTTAGSARRAVVVNVALLVLVTGLLVGAALLV